MFSPLKGQSLRHVPTQFLESLTVKYVWNVYCVAGITNHEQDVQPQKTKKHVEFPSVMEQICFISKGLKINPLFQLYNIECACDVIKFSNPKLKSH